MANIDIGGRLHSTATGNVVAGANEILDDNEQKKQSEINAELKAGLNEAIESIPHNVSELNNDVNYATAAALQESAAEMQSTMNAGLNNKQDVISAVVSPTITDDNGVPAVDTVFQNGQLSLAFKNLKLRFSDLTTEDREAIRGPQGDSAIWDENEPHEKLTNLAHVLGDSTVKPMSQNGVSRIIGYQIFESSYAFEAKPGGTVSIGHAYISMPAGTKIRLSVEGVGTVIGSWRVTLKNGSTQVAQYNPSVAHIDIETSAAIGDINFQVLAASYIAAGTVTASIEYIGIKHQVEKAEKLVPDVEELKDFKNVAEPIMSSVDALTADLKITKIVPEINWKEGRLYYEGKQQANTSAQYSEPIEVKKGDLLHVVATGVDQFTIMIAWLVSEDLLYDMIERYTATSQRKDVTIRMQKDGQISICRKKSTDATVEIIRGMDVEFNSVLPNWIGVPDNFVKKGQNNLFDPASAMNGLYFKNGSGGINYSGNYWTTGFIEIPANVRVLRISHNPNGNYAATIYGAGGNVLTFNNGLGPITVPANGKYIRITFAQSILPFAERYKLVVSSYWQETEVKPFATIDTQLLGTRDNGLFSISDLSEKAAVMVFGTYVSENNFNTGSEDDTYDINKVYIDSTTNVLYRYNGTAFVKAAVWPGRGKVFTQSFTFNILKSSHKENMIITATAKWVGETAPNIRMVTRPNGGQSYFKYTIQYIIGAKNNYSTKEWRPYNPLIHQDRIIVEVAIPAGTTLLVDEFCNYYSNRTEKGTYPQFHFRSGNGLNQGLTAWEEAAKLGYEYIIVIPKRTADGKWVVFHDDSDINSMYYEAGGHLTNSSAIGTYTYEQLMQYDIESGLVYRGNKLPLLENFFALCAKRGIHPCFSVHPNFTTAEWREVRSLADKWGVTKHLNLKAGYILGPECLINTAYPVFGNDIESYYVDINREGSGVSEVQNAISQFGIDTNKVRVGIEYFHAYATDANIQAARNAGIPVGVVLQNPNAAGVNGDTAANINHWIELGVSSFTDTCNPSVGLNW